MPTYRFIRGSRSKRVLLLCIILTALFIAISYFVYSNGNDFYNINEVPVMKSAAEKLDTSESRSKNPSNTAGGIEIKSKRRKPLATSVDVNDNTEKQLKNLKTEIAQLKKQIKSKVKQYPEVKYRTYKDRKRILITGGSGFVGSHLVDRLLLDGHEVIALDNHFTGRKRNIQHWIGHPNFELVYHDIVNPFYVEVDEIYHLASPASPPHYMYNPVKTIKTNVLGTMNVLGLARRTKARVLLASTSEVYGDPEVHPQPETYWGHVNPIGPRSCYDEGKRIAESLMMAYHKQEKIDIRIARIFNTYGPRMHMNDGRVVSNFILQALQDQPITIYGSGNQTRAFQYVSDLVNGLIRLMNSNTTLPVNLGNPDEHTIYEFADIIRRLINNQTEIVNYNKAEDDPQKRKPNIERAKRLLNWEPKVSLIDGLKSTIDYFRRELEHNRLALSREADDFQQTPLEHFESFSND